VKTVRVAYDGFEWDTGNLAKCQQHGLAIREIETFFEQLLLIVPDTRHSQAEERFIAVGRSATKRPLFVAFTMRPQRRGTRLRVISARYMHTKEVVAYETLRRKITDETA